MKTFLDCVFFELFIEFLTFGIKLYLKTVISQIYPLRLRVSIF